MKRLPRLAILGGRPEIPRSQAGFAVWPRTTKLDEKFVLSSLRGTAHAWGPNCNELGYEFSDWNGNRYGAATNSGTAALHMCVAACGIGAGDEVITTALSFTSSGTSILHHNAIPIFVDVDWDTMLIDPKKIAAAITPKTRAILPVHYFGLPCDMGAINRIARRHKLHVIEDACQAHGALYRGRKVGTLGHCAAFSLNQTKNLSAGEGGLFVTDSKKRFLAGVSLMSFGEMRSPGEKRDYHSYAMGWMYRTSDLAAAYGRSALRQLDANNVRARRNWERLLKGFQGLPQAILPHDSPEQRNNGYAFVLRLDPERFGTSSIAAARDKVVAALNAEGVPTEVPRWFLPAHTVFQAQNGYGRGCPWACSFARKGVDYSLDQYPVAQLVTDSCIQIAMNAHRPPNGAAQVDAVLRAVWKVFRQLDVVVGDA